MDLRNRHSDHAHSGRRARSYRLPRRWLRPFTAPAVAPTPPGDVLGPMRAAPLPSVRVVIVGGFLWGSPRADGSFGLVCLHRSAGVHRPPITSPWLTRLRGGDVTVRRSGLVHGPSRPRSVSVVGGSRRRRGLDHGGLADSEGSPGPAPGCGPPDGPNHLIMGPGRSGKPESRVLCRPPRPAARGIQSTHTQGETHSHYNLNASKTCMRTDGSRMCI